MVFVNILSQNLVFSRVAQRKATGIAGLFIRADESKELMEANLRARKLFNQEKKLQYTPHLSVLYGNIASETKAKIISEIGSAFDIELEVESIHLVLSSTNIEPKNWRRLKQFDLSYSNLQTHSTTHIEYG